MSPVDGNEGAECEEMALLLLVEGPIHHPAVAMKLVGVVVRKVSSYLHVQNVQILCPSDSALEIIHVTFEPVFVFVVEIPDDTERHTGIHRVESTGVVFTEAEVVVVRFLAEQAGTAPGRVIAGEIITDAVKQVTLGCLDVSLAREVVDFVEREARVGRVAALVALHLHLMHGLTHTHLEVLSDGELGRLHPKTMGEQEFSLVAAIGAVASFQNPFFGALVVLELLAAAAAEEVVRLGAANGAEHRGRPAC